MKRTTTIARFGALWGGIGALSCAAIALAADRSQTSSATSPTAVPKSDKAKLTVDASRNADEGGIAGGVLYTSNTFSGSYYSPNVGATGGVYTFDDVPMSDIVLNGASGVRVTRVTLGIYRTATALATDVNVYRATLTTNVTAPDTNLDVPPTLIGTVSLPASTVAGVVPVTIGDGTTPLFTHPLNRDVITGGSGEAFGSLAIGVQFSVNPPPATGNGWALTTGGDPNVNAFWQWNPGGAPEENYFWFGGTPAAQFHIELEGVPVFSCLADIDGTGTVDVDDLLAVINAWGPCANPNNCPPDIAPAGGNDVVDVDDMLGVINGWGACPPPVGACCDAAGVAACVESQAGACATAGDLWSGAGTTCATVTCPQVPPNDECATAAPITIGQVTADLTLANASAEPPGFGCQPISHDIWYTMATTPGTSYTVDTLLSDPGLDTVIELYDGAGGCAALLIQNCCDDTGGVGTTTSCTFNAVSATSIFRIGMWDQTPGGPITVRVSSP